MNIGEAVQLMKDGKSVRRAGWNGKGMHIYLEDGTAFPIGEGVYKGQIRTYDPTVFMYTAQKTHQGGWLCSQADLLAEDWEVVYP